MATVLLLIILGLIVVGIIAIVAMYNGLVSSRNRYKNSFAQIDVQLKRRHDLIPNLVEVARKYMQHERETLEAVIAARNAASNARGQAAADPGNPAAMQKLMTTEAALGGIMGKLFALAEAYPTLKANETMMQLSEELTTTENKVSFSRQAFNDAVMVYNTQCEQFPSVLIANSFGFKQAQLFEIEDKTEREAPKVKF
jgi:LemA protein